MNDFKNNDVIRTHRLFEGTYTIGEKERITEFSLRGNNNATVVFVDNIGRKGFNSLHDGVVSWVADDGFCIGKTEINVHYGFVDIFYREKLGLEYLEPQKLFIRKRILLIKK